MLRILAPALLAGSYGHWNGQTADSIKSSASQTSTGPQSSMNNTAWIAPYAMNNGFTDSTSFSIAYDARVAMALTAWGNTNTGEDAVNWVAAYSVDTGKMVYNVTDKAWDNLFNENLLLCKTTNGTSVAVVAVRDISTKYVFTGMKPSTGEVVWSITTPLAAWIDGAAEGSPYQCSEGALVVSFDKGQGAPTPSITTYDVSTGKTLAQHTGLPMAGAVELIIPASTTGTQAGIVVIGVDGKGACAAIDIASGSTLWIASNATNGISPEDVIASPDGQLVVILDISGDMAALPNIIWTLDAKTGKVLNSTGFPSTGGEGGSVAVMNFNSNWAWWAEPSGAGQHGTLIFGGSLTNDASPQYEYGSIVAWEMTSTAPGSISPVLIANLDMSVGANSTIDPDGIYEYPNVGGSSVVVGKDGRIYFTWLPTGFQWKPPADDDKPITDETSVSLASGVIDRANVNVTITTVGTPILNGSPSSQMAFLPNSGSLFVANGTHIFLLEE